VAAHTPSATLLGKLASAGFDPGLLDQNRSQQFGFAQHGPAGKWPR